MKKLKRLSAFILCMLLTLSLVPSNAQAETFSTYISTPTAVSAGDTFTVTLTFSSSSELSAINATVGYDSSKLEFLSLESSVGGIFSGQVGTRIIAYSTSSASSGTFAYLKFRAKSSFSAGETTYISVTEVTGTDADLNDVTGYGASVGIRMAGSSGGNEGQNQGQNQNPSWDPGTYGELSDDSSLASLSVTGADLSPEFAETVRAYTVSVPFETSELEISAVPNDEKATVSITNNILKAGKTTDVTVTVMAENGNYTVYTIRAAREQDPNYVPSDNCYLADIKVDCGSISPVFEKDRYKYVINAPAGTKQVTIEADAEHEEATVKTMGSAELSPGRENVYHIVCTAEDGISSKIYTVTVIVPQEYDFFLKKSYLLSVQQLIRAADYGTVLDLTSSPVQMLSRDIFDSLRDEEDGILVVRTQGGTFTFRSGDILEEDPANFYDFTVLHTSDYADKHLPSLASYQNYVFSTHSTGLFPGSASVSIYTNYVKGQTVNVYVYDPETSEYVYAAKNVMVGDGGTVTFDIDRGGDFIISTKDVPGASTYRSADKNPVRGIPSRYLYLGIGVLLTVFGFLAGLAADRIASRRRKKKATEETGTPDSSEEEETVETEPEDKEDAMPAPVLPDDASPKEESSETQEVQKEVFVQDDSGIAPQEKADDQDMDTETVSEIDVPSEEGDIPCDDMTEEVSPLPAEESCDMIPEELPVDGEDAITEVSSPEKEEDPVLSILPDTVAEDIRIREIVPAEYDDLAALDGEKTVVQESDVPETEGPVPENGEALSAEEELIPPGTELISAPGADEARPVSKERKKFFSFGSRKKKDEIDEDMEAFEALLDKVNRSKN